jgi:hypothetical protein
MFMKKWVSCHDRKSQALSVTRWCSFQRHYKYQKTKNQGPDKSEEKVQFTASLKIPEDQGPD